MGYFQGTRQPDKCTRGAVTLARLVVIKKVQASCNVSFSTFSEILLWIILLSHHNKQPHSVGLSFQQYRKTDFLVIINLGGEFTDLLQTHILLHNLEGVAPLMYLCFISEGPDGSTFHWCRSSLPKSAIRCTWVTPQTTPFTHNLNFQ